MARDVFGRAGRPPADRAYAPDDPLAEWLETERVEAPRAAFRGELRDRLMTIDPATLPRFASGPAPAGGSAAMVAAVIGLGLGVALLLRQRAGPTGPVTQPPAPTPAVVATDPPAAPKPAFRPAQTEPAQTGVEPRATTGAEVAPRVRSAPLVGPATPTPTATLTATPVPPTPSQRRQPRVTATPTDADQPPTPPASPTPEEPGPGRVTATPPPSTDRIDAGRP